MKPAVLVAFLSLSFGAGRVADAQTIRFASTAPLVNQTADGRLLLDLWLTNSSAKMATDVSVTQISLRSANRLFPVAMPITFDSIGAGQLVRFQLGFDTGLLQNGSSYLLALRGTYRDSGVLYGFAVTRFVQIPSVGVPAGTTLTLAGNRTDPLVLKVLTAAGAVVEFFGPKDVTGVPNGINVLRITDSAGQVTTHFLDLTGRLAESWAPNGVVFHYSWQSAALVAVTMLLPDGSQTTATVDLSALAPVARASEHESRVARASFKGKPPLFEQVSRRESAVAPSLRPAARSLTNAEQEQSSAAASNLVAVRVSECLLPVDDALVTVRMVNSGSGATIPAGLIGNGVYSAQIPAPDPEAGANAEGKCKGAASFLATVCIAAEVMPAMCVGLASAAAATFPPSGPLAAEIIVACVEAAETIEVACKSLDYSPVQGAPSVAETLCENVRDIVDRYEDTPISLQASATVGAITLASDFRSNLPPTGPFDGFEIDIPGVCPTYSGDTVATGFSQVREASHNGLCGYTTTGILTGATLAVNGMSAVVLLPLTEDAVLFSGEPGCLPAIHWPITTFNGTISSQDGKNYSGQIGDAQTTIQISATIAADNSSASAHVVFNATASCPGSTGCPIVPLTPPDLVPNDIITQLFFTFALPRQQ